MMNESILKGKWTEIKGEIRNAWGNLTGDELESTKGNATAISGLLQQKYGMAKEEATQKLNDLYARFGAKMDETRENLEHKANVKTEEVKQDLKHS